MAVERTQINCRLVPHPGQNTLSHGVSASSAARIAADHSISRPVASRLVPALDCSFSLGARGPTLSAALAGYGRAPG
jgi:hypothetical protein